MVFPHNSSFSIYDPPNRISSISSSGNSFSSRRHSGFEVFCGNRIGTEDETAMKNPQTNPRSCATIPLTHNPLFNIFTQPQSEVLSILHNGNVKKFVKRGDRI